jgi:endoglucanase
VTKHLREICNKNKIPFQLRVASKGSNDSKVMQRSAAGIPVAALSLPVRYIHSNVEVANKTDVDAAVALVTRFAAESGAEKYR